VESTTSALSGAQRALIGSIDSTTHQKIGRYFQGIRRMLSPDPNIRASGHGWVRKPPGLVLLEGGKQEDPEELADAGQ